MSRGRTHFISLSPGVWGAEKSLLLLAEGMHQAGEPIELLCFDEGLADEWHRVVGADVSRRRRGSKIANLIRAISYAITRPARSRIVLFSYELLAVAPLLRVARPDLKVFWDHHDYLTGPRAERLLRVLGRFIDGSVCVSRFVESQVPGRTIVLTRPVDLSRSGTSSSPRSRRPFDIGIVGRVDSDKGHDVVIRAAAPLPDDARVVVRGDVGLGSANWRDDIVGLGEDLLGGRFVWEGVVRQDAAMSGLSCLVVANVAEPMGRTVLEAQSAGVPVIVPNSGGARELVEPGRTGLTFTTQQELTAALKALYDDEGLCRQLAVSGQTAVRDLDQSGYAERYVQGLDRLARRGTRETVRG